MRLYFKIRYIEIHSPLKVHMGETNSQSSINCGVCIKSLSNNLCDKTPQTMLIFWSRKTGRSEELRQQK